MSWHSKATSVATQRLRIVICGHVDHGKSTVLGRLMVDMGVVSESKLASVRALCARTSRQFEYAFLIDSLRDERAQGITIDAARVFFRAKSREYMFVDAPGHIDMLGNMLTGVSRSDAALVVIDAQQGLMQGTHHHVGLLAMMGIQQVIVAINKMDLVQWDRRRFEVVAAECTSLFSSVGIGALEVVPVSGQGGDNIAARSDAALWYNGKTILEAFDSIQGKSRPEVDTLRLPVQGVFKFTEYGDDRRIVVGSVESGRICEGDEILVVPSGRTARVRKLVTFPETQITAIDAGGEAGVLLDEDIYIKRGEVLVHSMGSQPIVAARLRAMVFWLAPEALRTGQSLTIRLGTDQVHIIARTVSAHLLPNSHPMSARATDMLPQNTLGICDFEMTQPIVVDVRTESRSLNRFVLFMGPLVVGAGVVLRAWSETETFAAPTNISPKRRRLLESLVVVVVGGATGTRRLISLQIAKRFESVGLHCHVLQPSDTGPGVLDSVRILLDAGVRIVAGLEQSDATSELLAEILLIAGADKLTLIDIDSGSSAIDSMSEKNVAAQTDLLLSNAGCWDDI